MNVSWFSTGVSSAVATKMIIDEIDKIIYIHIDDQHEDSMRFVKDCEQWFGKEIEILQSEYKCVNNVVRSTRYVNGPAGAACTRILKKRTRIEWEKDHEDCDLTYIWGMDCNESHRLDRLIDSMPNQKHRCPLIEQSISKEHAHQILNASGIKRPIMYDMAYQNNNCIGCVKGGAGYWQAIKRDFPGVFWLRARMEREVGRSCLKEYFLDELPPDYGRDQKPIVDDCGIFCELEAL
jgi:hypothetical protein